MALWCAGPLHAMQVPGIVGLMQRTENQHTAADSHSNKSEAGLRVGKQAICRTIYTLVTTLLWKGAPARRISDTLSSQ